VTRNTRTPIADGRTPLLALDLWEHAYDADYGTRRKDYVQRFLDGLVDWPGCEERLLRLERESLDDDAPAPRSARQAP
jgi:superoxide dismutase